MCYWQKGDYLMYQKIMYIIIAILSFLLIIANSNISINLNDGFVGVLIGGTITSVFAFILDYIKSNRDEKIYNRRNREKLYKKMIRYLEEYECNYKQKKEIDVNPPKEIVILLNEIQFDLIDSTKEIKEVFFRIAGDMGNIVLTKKFDRDKFHKESNKKILDFMEKVRKELNIED